MPLQSVESEIHIFLQRCDLAFSQMLFEDMSNLYDQIKAYKSGKPYAVKASRISIDMLASKKMSNIENELVFK